jgi:hypothetical protein
MIYLEIIHDPNRRSVNGDEDEGLVDRKHPWQNT